MSSISRLADVCEQVFTQDEMKKRSRGECDACGEEREKMEYMQIISNDHWSSPTPNQILDDPELLFELESIAGGLCLYLCQDCHQILNSAHCDDINLECHTLNVLFRGNLLIRATYMKGFACGTLSYMFKEIEDKRCSSARTKEFIKYHVGFRCKNNCVGKRCHVISHDNDAPSSLGSFERFKTKVLEEFPPPQ
jgi:hypothetical protein